MPNIPEDQDQIVDLANSMCDETITPEQLALLERLLNERPDLRHVYLEYLRLHAGLIWRFRTGDTPPEHQAEVVDAEGSVRLGDNAAKSQLRISSSNLRAVLRRRWAFVGAVACCLMVAALFALQEKDAIQSATFDAETFVATLHDATHVVWSNDDQPVDVGSRVPAGKLQLDVGEAELVFDSGAKLLLAGPAELELQTPLSVLVKSGRIAAHMPETAVGFKLRTPTSTLVDQGTEFGVAVDLAGSTQVHVFKGQVDLHYSKTGSAEVLTEKLAMVDRHARQIDQPGSIGTEIAFSKAHFGSIGQRVTEPLQWKVADGGNGHYYELIIEKSPIDWHDAARLSLNKYFRGMPGHLVTMTSAAEDRFVVDNLLEDVSLRGVWMGLTDVLREGHFRWVTGEPFQYSNWAVWPEAQPDNFREADWHGGEDYGMYAHFPGKQPWAWNDLSIDSMYEKVSAYIVEYEPPVAALRHRSMVLDPIHWPIKDGGNGHYYRMVLSLESMDWQTIREWAEATELLGVQGQLVAMETAEERAFVADNILRICGIPEIMIGLSGSLERNDLQWTNGQAIVGVEVEQSHLPTDLVYGVFRWNPAGKWQTGWEISAISADILPAGWFGYLIEYPMTPGEGNP